MLLASALSILEQGFQIAKYSGRRQDRSHTGRLAE